MTRLTEQQILAGFETLGLLSEEERAKFVGYAPQTPPDMGRDFIRIDNTTRASETIHGEKEGAQLACPPR